MCMNNYDKYKWKEIYNYCSYYAMTYLNFNSLKIETVEVEQLKDDYRIGGYDWDTIKNIEYKVDVIKRSPSEFLVCCDSVNKGTLHTVKLLDNAKDDEERFAIWLYAFTFELLEYRMYPATREIVQNIMLEARRFLDARVHLWHHSMKRLIPEIYISPKTFDVINTESFEPIVELALMNAMLIQNEYKAVRYITKED